MKHLELTSQDLAFIRGVLKEWNSNRIAHKQGDEIEKAKHDASSKAVEKICGKLKG